RQVPLGFDRRRWVPMRGAPLAQGVVVVGVLAGVAAAALDQVATAGAERAGVVDVARLVAVAAGRQALGVGDHPLHATLPSSMSASWRITANVRLLAWRPYWLVVDRLSWRRNCWPSLSPQRSITIEPRRWRNRCMCRRRPTASPRVAQIRCSAPRLQRVPRLLTKSAVCPTRATSVRAASHSSTMRAVASL